MAEVVNAGVEVDPGRGHGWADLGLLPVAGAFGGPARGVGAGGSLPAFGVAVAHDKTHVAGVGDVPLSPTAMGTSRETRNDDVRPVSANRAPKAGEGQRKETETQYGSDLQL